MKITVHIEVASAEELGKVAQALGGVDGAEVSHALDTDVSGVSNSTVVDPAPTPAKRKGKGKAASSTKNTFDGPSSQETYEEVPSQFSGQTAADIIPEAPLVSEQHVQMPPQQAAQSHVAAQQTAAHQIPPFPNAQNHIVAEAGRLEKAANVPGEVKKNIINSLLVEIQAPQGVRASQLPEPYLTFFASKISAKVDGVIAQYSNTVALV